MARSKAVPTHPSRSHDFTDAAQENRSRYRARRAADTCGLGIIAKWHCPDHTKIEEFRNRLQPATHKAIADPSWMDLDATVQEANIAYPSDAALMRKLAHKCMKVWEYLKSTGKRGIDKLRSDMSSIGAKSKEYFFLAKNVALENEFGRVFQLGRIGGNFVIPFIASDLRMDDKKSFTPVLQQHANLFGQGCLKSIATDKGYYSKGNVLYCDRNGINATGIQRPNNTNATVAPELALPWRNRRAGIEPLIGHLKRFGLGKSRMRSDAATLASGYRSVTGFNLHQMIKKMGKIAA